MKLNLVDDAKDWSRWWSMRWIILTTFFASSVAAFAALPPALTEAVPPWARVSLAVGTVFSSAASGVARVLKQP
jgi:hypothetical protein